MQTLQEALTFLGQHPALIWTHLAAMILGQAILLFLWREKPRPVQEHESWVVVTREEDSPGVVAYVADKPTHEGFGITTEEAIGDLRQKHPYTESLPVVKS